MKKLIISAACVPASLTVLAASVQAENQAGQIVINPSAVYMDHDIDRNLDDGSGYGLGLEYRFGPHWAVEVAGANTEADIENTETEIDIKQFRLDGLYYTKPDGTFQPYLAFGAGRGDYNGGIDDESQANLGGGVRINLSQMFSLRLDVRGVHGLEEDQTDLMSSLGFSLAFGGTPAPVEATYEPAEPPAPMDADGDGVPDESDQCSGTGAGVEVDATGCPLDADMDGVTDDIDECLDTEPDAVVDETGCVGVSETVTVETIELNIQFPSGSTNIPAEYRDQLQEVAAFLSKYDDVTINIEGHTDSQGSAAFNKKLSQQRADSVRDALIAYHGVDADRVTATGYGEEQPIASNETAEGRKQNRRVVALVQKEVRK